MSHSSYYAPSWRRYLHRFADTARPIHDRWSIRMEIGSDHTILAIGAQYVHFALLDGDEE